MDFEFWVVNCEGIDIYIFFGGKTVIQYWYLIKFNSIYEVKGLGEKKYFMFTWNDLL